MKTGMQPARITSVRRLLDAVSPGGSRQNLLRCMYPLRSSYGICIIKNDVTLPGEFARLLSCVTSCAGCMASQACLLISVHQVEQPLQV